jgi:hypothetical protein
VGWYGGGESFVVNYNTITKNTDHQTHDFNFISQTTQKDFSQTPPKTIHPHQRQIFLGEARNYFWQLGIGSASHATTLPLI